MLKKSIVLSFVFGFFIMSGTMILADDASVEQSTKQETPEVSQEQIQEPAAGVVQKAVEKPKEKLKKEESKPKAKNKYFESKSFVVPLDFQMDGKIVGTKDDKTLISQGDVVYVDIGANNDIKKGTRCNIYRKKEKIRNSNGDAIGYQIIRLGILQLTENINEDSATAVIYKSYEPIVKGDYIQIAK
ncbi:MAG: hypothetical protein KKH91_08050 [Elusimicrobia bacterium]|nr:hypothetical protein [Elusimicrobiota bacterium]